MYCVFNTIFSVDKVYTHHFKAKNKNLLLEREGGLERKGLISITGKMKHSQQNETKESVIHLLATLICNKACRTKLHSMIARMTKES